MGFDGSPLATSVSRIFTCLVTFAYYYGVMPRTHPHLVQGHSQGEADSGLRGTEPEDILLPAEEEDALAGDGSSSALQTPLLQQQQPQQNGNGHGADEAAATGSGSGGGGKLPFRQAFWRFLALAIPGGIMVRALVRACMYAPISIPLGFRSAEGWPTDFQPPSIHPTHPSLDWTPAGGARGVVLRLVPRRLRAVRHRGARRAPEHDVHQRLHLPDRALGRRHLGHDPRRQLAGRAAAQAGGGGHCLPAPHAAAAVCCPCRTRIRLIDIFIDDHTIPGATGGPHLPRRGRVGDAAVRDDHRGAEKRAGEDLLVGSQGTPFLFLPIMPYRRTKRGAQANGPNTPKTQPPQVIQIVANLCPIMALYQCFDGLQGVSSGILRGMGRQKRVALLNLCGFWVLGLPFGLLLAFVGGLNVYGIWWGFNSGTFVL